MKKKKGDRTERQNKKGLLENCIQYYEYKKKINTKYILHLNVMSPVSRFNEKCSC